MRKITRREGVDVHHNVPLFEKTTFCLWKEILVCGVTQCEIQGISNAERKSDVVFVCRDTDGTSFANCFVLKANRTEQNCL